MARALGLVLDLCVGGFAATVDAEGNALASRWQPPSAKHDDVDLWVEDCLREADITFSGLEWIAVGIGPGSFTGIRIAMAFAQGLALPRETRVYGFTSFAALHLSAPGLAPGALAVIPANAGRYYVSQSLEDSGSMMTEEQLRALGGGGKNLVVACDVPALDAIRAAFQRVQAVEHRWNLPELIRFARASGLGAEKPFYLALSAAEAKAEKDSPSHGA